MGFLEDVEKRLDLPSGQKSDVMRELGEHYDDLLQELDQGWQKESELDRLIAQRLGTPEEIAARLSAIHNSASWGSTVLTVLPFAASAVVKLLPSESAVRVAAIAAILLITVAASLRQLLLGRRPVWLSTWLACGLISAISLIHYYGARLQHTDDSFAWLAGLTFLLSVMAPVVACRLRPSREITLALSLLGAACSAYLAITTPAGSASFLMVMGAVAVAITLAVLFSRSMLEKHPYGNAFRASLFLAALAVLRYPVTNGSKWTLILAVAPLLVILPALWGVRDPSFRGKDRAIRWTIWLYMFAWFWRSHDLGHVVGLVINSYIAQMVVCSVILIPMWRENQRREEERKMARLEDLCSG